ncbi:MAG: hypothetical protein ACOH2T_19070 [Pseudomonas sp.]
MPNIPSNTVNLLEQAIDNIGFANENNAIVFLNQQKCIKELRRAFTDLEKAHTLVLEDNAQLKRQLEAVFTPEVVPVEIKERYLQTIRAFAVPNWVKWVATDGNGQVYGYSHCPVLTTPETWDTTKTWVTTEAWDITEGNCRYLGKIDLSAHSISIADSLTRLW